VLRSKRVGEFHFFHHTAGHYQQVCILSESKSHECQTGSLTELSVVSICCDILRRSGNVDQSDVVQSETT
jgi:hypothetical protein